MYRHVPAAAAALACACLAASAAAQAPDAPAVDAPSDACAYLGDGPSATLRRMLRLDVVFGKDALYWTEGDFARVRELAKACDGRRYGPRRIVAREWWRTLDQGRRQILPIVQVNAEVVDYGRTLAPERIRLPDCRSAATPGADEKALFGRDFLAMSDGDVLKTIDYLNQCKPLLLMIGQVNPAMAYSSKSEPRVNLVMDAALRVVAEREKWKTVQRAKTDLLLTREDGAVLIWTMLTERTQRTLETYNEWRRGGRPMTVDTASALMKGVREVLEGIPAGQGGEADRRYAEAIRDAVHVEAFDGN